MMTGAEAVKDGWMWTYSGKLVQPYNLDPAHVCIEDIAHALSMQCRFAGHTRRHYSVAEHSILVSLFAGFQGLMHDASEAYLTDQPSPIKHQLHGYKAAEARCMQSIGEGLGVHLTPNATGVHWADRQMLLVEIEDLLPRREPVEMGQCMFTAVERHEIRAAMRMFESSNQVGVERVFLQRYYDLRKSHGEWRTPTSTRPKL